ncbi:hypothetical protein B0H17DRAFT_1216513 [Mycena rosella]|uniref:Uncharacterized protein n=1 Tax=Mycena rosella TaxID=1033263 RepID=A0AAD7C700_MYCRO|nr:hypothetical protein B0H17DRAFT_1216513 [Mycena rosella]
MVSARRAVSAGNAAVAPTPPASVTSAPAASIACNCKPTVEDVPDQDDLCSHSSASAALPAAGMSRKAKGKGKQVSQTGPNPKPLTTVPKDVVATVAPENSDVPLVNSGAFRIFERHYRSGLDQHHTLFGVLHRPVLLQLAQDIRLCLCSLGGRWESICSKLGSSQCSGWHPRGLPHSVLHIDSQSPFKRGSDQRQIVEHALGSEHL